MTHKCCVRDCEEAVRETRSRGLPLHKFPKDALMRQRWLVSGGFEPEFRPTASQIVCYKHFRQSDYEVGRSHKLFLKKGSVPSIFRDYESHPDPIGPTSAFITNRLLAREAAATAAREAANNSNFIKVVEVADNSGCLESSCSSLEASMDSSNSIQMVDGGDAKERIDSPAKSLSASDSEMVKVAVIAQETHMEEKKMDESKRVPNRAGINFMPGTKLEAKDFNEKWYSAKVVEVDWIEREVLIHFDKWSSRFDEWIPMDSSRLRTSQIPGASQEGAKTMGFVAGERILATWVDGKKYPAKVNGILGNDKYDVLFDDGYTKILKSSKMTRLAEVGLIGTIKPPPGHDDGPAASNTYVGSKQERRDKKRKHTITELFQHKKKVKPEGEKAPKKQETHVKFAPKVEAVSTVVRAEPVVPDIYQYPENTGKLEGIKRNIFKTCGNEFLRGTDEKFKGYVAGVDEDYTTFIGNLRVEIEDSTYKCPKTGCNKNFRKENLLQMHIKHYHPEYSKFLGSTPNVADLAYARTIGESVEDLIPKKIRVPTTPTAPIVHPILTTPPPGPHTIETDYKQSDVDSSFETKLSVENNMSPTEDNSSEHNSCTLSPGRLFDMRSKEEKLHTGIKTLPPVRPPVVQPPPVQEPVQPVNIPIEIQKPSTSNDKIKVHRKRQQYQTEPTVKVKKHRVTLEPEENYENLDNNLQETDDTPDLNYKCNNTSNNKVEVDSNVENTQNKIDDVQLINGELIKVEKLRREEIINCTCGIIEEDGLMIQCDLCLCWQHGHCNNIEIETDVPEKYICFTCQNSHRQRPSKKYIHDQEWIREGKLPSIRSFPEDPAAANKRTAMLKRSYDLIASILQIQDLLHSLRVKVNVAQNKDHPKLYLWAKNWSKVKIPTFTPEPVPIMEVVKSENRMDGNADENAKENLDFSFSIKNDPDQKLITSDTELMKILEEDPMQPEEIKPDSKNFKDEGRILLDALTRNGDFDDQEALKAEINGDLRKSPEKSPVKPTATLTQPIIPEPEAAIDPVECKLRLLEHIDHYQNYVESVLNYVEVHIAALEDFDENVAKPDHDEHTQTKQTIQMLMHDLETIRKLAALC